MSFTDADLKRLKELDIAASVHDKYGNEEIRKTIPDLLARLEAAEEVVEIAAKAHLAYRLKKGDSEIAVTQASLGRAIGRYVDIKSGASEAWRKAAGK